MRLKKEQRTRGLPFGDKTKEGECKMNYREIAGQILQHMGGKDNISAVTYCMTRLRMTPKDKGLVNEEALRGISGIVGLKIVGAQYQVIIGPDVEHVYKEFCQ